VSNRLRLNFGLRWDAQYLIDPEGRVAQSITDQWQPRLGFTYQLGKPGTQKIFGSFGRFYQQFPSYLAASFYNGETWENYVDLYFEDPRNPGAEPFLRPFDASGLYGQPVDDLKGEYYDEFILGYEALFDKHYKIGIRGIFRTLRDVVGRGYASGDDGVPSFQNMVVGNWGRGELDFLPEPQSDYTALELTLERYGARRFNFLSSMVLSRHYGNYAGIFVQEWGKSMPGEYIMLEIEEQVPNSTGLLPNDRPLVFKFYGTYNFSPRLKLGTFFTWMSGTPLNEFGAANLFGRYTYLVKRGSAGRMPSTWDLNLRLSYEAPRLFNSDVQAKIFLDLLHIRDSSNVKPIQIDQYTVNVTYGDVILYQQPMTARLGVEFYF
jgi:hypothetical protein